MYANQIAFGRLYREKLKEQVEALGYETEVVGKHGMWEMPGVPVEAFSGHCCKVSDEAAFCLIQRPYISKNSAYQAHFAQGITIIKC